MDIPTIGEAVTGMKAAFDLLKGAIGVAKEAKDLVEDDSRRASVGASLEAAERALHLAEAQIAQTLGYRLCRCSFPPQVMLSISGDSANETYQCPSCKKTWPSPSARAALEQPRPDWRRKF